MLEDLVVAGYPVAFLVLYPSAGFSQSFPPGRENEKLANEHAKLMNGMLVALPLLRDYRLSDEVVGAGAGYGQAPVNPLSINALPEPGDGTIVQITSGTRAGQLYRREDSLAQDTWGDDTRVRWWSDVENRFKLWIDVQQRIGEASWKVVPLDEQR